ncbi:MAG: D-aminoacyl-tRNA deacylase [Betaproteobacteria bacterium]
MRTLIQRVSEASVSVDAKRVGAIDQGVLVLAGVADDDTDEDIEWLARKIVALRIFDDEDGVMNRSLRDSGGDILAVSQFTLMASTRKGARLSYAAAAAPELAQPRFDALVAALSRELGRVVATGVFGAHMRVALINDGPVTIWLDSRIRE